MQAAERGVKRIRLHLLTDGRDCTDGSSVKLMQAVVAECGKLGESGCDARVASGGGRMKVTMDRCHLSWSSSPLSRDFWEDWVATPLVWLWDSFGVTRIDRDAPLVGSITPGRSVLSWDHDHQPQVSLASFRGATCKERP